MAGLREKQKKARERRIIEVALDLFINQGFHETTMEEIAEKAEVGVGTLYNYIKSKGDLLLLILTEKTEDIYGDAELIIENASDDILDTLFQLFSVYFNGITILPNKLAREFFAIILSGQSNTNDLATFMALDYKLMGQISEMLKIYQSKALINSSMDSESLSFALYCLFITSYITYMMQDDLSKETSLMLLKSQLQIIYYGMKPRE